MTMVPSSVEHVEMTTAMQIMSLVGLRQIQVGDVVVETQEEAVVEDLMIEETVDTMTEVVEEDIMIEEEIGVGGIMTGEATGAEDSVIEEASVPAVRMIVVVAASAAVRMIVAVTDMEDDQMISVVERTTAPHLQVDVHDSTW
jgi:hypothetical protein